MSAFSKDRRRLMQNTAAWIGGLAILATGGSAKAFQVYQANPASGVGLAFANRCGPASEHAGLMSQLQAQLAGDPSVTEMTTTCPICGCPVTVSR